MNWYPNRRKGLLWGAGLLLALGLADFSLLRGVLGAPVDTWLFLRALLLVATLPLGAFLLYACYGLATLTYRVERNGIMIRWGAVYDMVPVSEIVEIVPYAGLGGRLVEGVGWPGYRVGRAKPAGIGALRMYITRPPEACLLVRTRERAYLISPANPEGFVADYATRRKLGPIVKWAQELRLPRLFDLSIRRDRLAACLAAAALLMNGGLFAYLTTRYPDLPMRLVLSYDLRGQADRIGGRGELFFLPAIGLAVVLLNGLLAGWLHRRERVLALVVLCNGPLVQALMWLATLRLAR